MREIKFRAWDKVKEFFVDPGFYFIELDGSAWFNLGGAAFSEDNLIDQSEKLELMQYTGLKDKNGKEIYEGDILKEGEGDCFSVVWDDDYAKFKLQHGKAYQYPGWNRGKEMEVIGNIYENPELLEG